MISVRNLSKRFKDLIVFSDLNLDVNQGETLVILGPSGIGKSILLKHLIGLIKPDSGSVDINGIRITDLQEEALSKAIANMGMLFQGAALFDSMNIEKNVGFYLSQHVNPITQKEYTSEEITTQVNYALELVGLKGTQKKMPSELSGGMRKRAALARLIVYRPKIVLYDEPTTGLDPIIAMEINKLIVKTQDELKATSLIVTHDMLSALCVADRLALIRDGKIAYIADRDRFLEIDDSFIKSLYNSISQDPRKLREKVNHG